MSLWQGVWTLWCPYIVTTEFVWQWDILSCDRITSSMFVAFVFMMTCFLSSIAKSIIVELGSPKSLLNCLHFPQYPMWTSNLSEQCFCLQSNSSRVDIALRIVPETLLHFLAYKFRFITFRMSFATAPKNDVGPGPSCNLLFRYNMFVRLTKKREIPLSPIICIY